MPFGFLKEVVPKFGNGGHDDKVHPPAIHPTYSLCSCMELISIKFCNHLEFNCGFT
jgi:hypothetical protein